MSANQPTNETNARLLTRRELQSLIGLSRSSIYRLIESDATFPKPITFGPDGPGKRPALRWIESEANAYLNARIVARDATSNAEETPNVERTCQRR